MGTGVIGPCRLKIITLGCKATVEFYLFGELISSDVGFNEFSFAKECPRCDDTPDIRHRVQGLPSRTA